MKSASAEWEQGLEEDEITGVSSLIGGGTGLERERLQGTQTGLDTDHVLEEKEITGFSNWRRCSECCTVGLVEDKIAWYSNFERRN